jgi:hypothetical protein
MYKNNESRDTIAGAQMVEKCESGVTVYLNAISIHISASLPIKYSGHLNKRVGAEFAMDASARATGHDEIDAVIKEEQDILSKISALEADLRIAKACADHLEKRFVEESRERKEDIRPVTTADMVTAHRDIMRLESEIGGLRMRLFLTQSRMAALKERQAEIERKHGAEPNRC